MPRRDGTGPLGMGPMTGRGMGYCAGFVTPAFGNAGFGTGRGRGFRRMFYMTGMPGWARYGGYPHGFPVYAGATAEPVADEKEVLQNQVPFLEKQLNQVRERLKGLEEEE